MPMKTLKEVRLDYVREVLENTGWDFEEAGRILNISEEQLHREVRRLSRFSTRTSGKRPVEPVESDKKRK
jgi:hypothetical protein